MSWHQNRMCAFDLETTGISVEDDRVVTAAVIGVGGGRDIEPHAWMADPGIPIPDEAARVHGITTEEAQAKGEEAPSAINQIAQALADHLNRGVPIVGHNVVYDLTLLDRECARHNLPTLLDRYNDNTLWPVIDTRVLDQHALPFRKRPSPTQGPRQLSTLAQVYDLGWDEEAAHGSDYDALMAARIAFRISQVASMDRENRPDKVRHARRERFDDIAGQDLEALHHAQITWAAEQAASLQEYFRKKDPNAHVEGAWPLIPRQRGESQ